MKQNIGSPDATVTANGVPHELSGDASVAQPKDDGDLHDFATRYVARAREIRGDHFVKRQALRELMAEASAERGGHSDGRYWVLSGLWSRMSDAAWRRGAFRGLS